MIGDADLLHASGKTQQERVLARDPAVVEEMIRRSLAVKGRIVEEDPREKGSARCPQSRPHVRPRPGERVRVSPAGRTGKQSHGASGGR